MFKQSPDNHLKGNGCPCCADTIPLTTAQFQQKVLRKYPQMEKILLKNRLEFIKEKCIKIPQTTHSHSGKLRRYDFYIPKYNLLIELDGTFHFKHIAHFNTSVKKIINNDLFKNALATNSLDGTNYTLNCYNLLRFDYQQTSQSMETLLLNTIANIQNNKWQGFITLSDFAFYSKFYTKYYNLQT